jgi:ankyrin repeat protein
MTASQPTHNEKNAFFEAARAGDLAGLNAFLDRYGDAAVDTRTGHDSTALVEAAMYGQRDALELLLDRGADIHAYDWANRTSALMAAAGAASADCVRLLVARGADLEAQDSLGQTALVRMAGLGQNLTVALLLDLGADIHAGARSGHTALRMAAHYRQSHTVLLLLGRDDAEDDVNRKDPLGYTPLMWAANGGAAAMTEALLRAGADTQLRNNDGEKAFDIAKRKGFDGIAQTLWDATFSTALRKDELKRKRELKQQQQAQKNAAVETTERETALDRLKRRAPKFKPPRRPPQP